MNNNGYSDSYLNKSAIYIEEGKIEKSIEVLTEGIKYNPYAKYLYYNRACCYARLNEPEKAIKDLRKAIILYPKIIEMINVDDDLDNLREDERFITLLNQRNKDI